MLAPVPGLDPALLPAFSFGVLVDEDDPAEPDVPEESDEDELEDDDEESVDFEPDDDVAPFFEPRLSVL